MVPAGSEPALLRWRLHWSPDGDLAVDAEDVTGGDVGPADRVAGGPARRRCSRRTPSSRATSLCGSRAGSAGDVPEILRGQVAVGLYDATNRLLDATGVQIAGVLDDVYADAAAERTYGVTFAWCAAVVPDLGADGPGRRPADLAGRISRRRSGVRCDAHADGAARRRVVDGDRRRTRNARYLYDVTVWAPSTRRGREQPGHRPVLRRADAGLHQVGGRRPRRPHLPAGAVADHRRRRSWRGRSTRRSTSCTCATSRSATRPCPRPIAAPTWRSPTTATGPGTCGPWPTPGSTPCTCCPASTSPRSARTRASRRRRRRPTAATSRRTRPTASSSRPASTEIRSADALQLGLRPAALRTPTGRTRRRPPRPTVAPGSRSSARWSAGCTGRPARGARPGLQPHRGGGAGREVRARPGGAGLLPPARPERRGVHLDLLPERRHRARDGREADGRLGGHLGARLPRRRVPVRPDGPPLDGRTCSRCGPRSTG